MVPLMLALALEVYLLGLIILRTQATSGTIAGLVLLVFAGLWFGFPLGVRSRAGKRSQSRASACQRTQVAPNRSFKSRNGGGRAESPHARSPRRSGTAAQGARCANNRHPYH